MPSLMEHIVGEMQHRFQVVVCLWEQDPQLFLNDPALLPPAPLAATNQPEALLRRVAVQIGQLELEQLGGVDPALGAIIRRLVVEQLEQLVEALLNFTEVTDLAGWLEQI